MLGLIVRSSLFVYSITFVTTVQFIPTSEVEILLDAKAMFGEGKSIVIHLVENESSLPGLSGN